MTVTQPMVFPDGPNYGLAKVLKQVCLERFGPEAIQGKKQDGLGNSLDLYFPLLKLKYFS